MKRGMARKIFDLVWLIMFCIIALAGAASIERVDYSVIDPNLKSWVGGLAMLLFSWAGMLYILSRYRGGDP